MEGKPSHENSEQKKFKDNCIYWLRASPTFGECINFIDLIKVELDSSPSPGGAGPLAAPEGLLAVHACENRQVLAYSAFLPALGPAASALPKAEA